VGRKTGSAGKIDLAFPYSGAARKKTGRGILRSGGLLGGSRPGYFVAAACLRAVTARDTGSYAVAKNEPD